MPSEIAGKRATQIRDHFSLRQFTAILDDFQPPTGPFAPDGAWQETFAVFTCPRGYASRVGTVTLVRTPQKDGGVLLKTTVDRILGPGGRHVTSEEIRYNDVPFPVPTNWRIEVRGRDADDRPIPEARLDLHGEVRERKFRFRAGDAVLRSAELPADVPWSCPWLLFDAVRRFPRRAGWRQPFTFIERSEVPKPGHEIAWRFSTNLLLGAKSHYRYTEARRLDAGTVFRPIAEHKGGRVVRVYTFEHVGPGLVPFVYWVDSAGRLLFAVSGLEAYVHM